MSNETNSKRAWLLAGTVLTSLAFGLPAMAQDTQDTTAATTTTDTPPADASATKSDDTVTEVTVVGSRLRKDTYNSASPIEVITRKDAIELGLTSAAEILQGTAVTNGSSQINNAYGGYIVNGGSGTNTVGLRGLGPGRTLVLINGRRVSPAGSGGAIGSADLNTLPSAMIGQIEVLRDGASAIYGSDAIGGVINIVTRKVDGTTIEVQGSVPDKSAGQQTRISIVTGKTAGKLTVQGSFEYYDQTALKLKDRDWTQCQTDYWPNPDGGFYDDIDPLTGNYKCYPINATGDNGVTINTLGTATSTGVAGPGNEGRTRFNRWRPNAANNDPSLGLVGYEGVSGSYANRDTFDERMLNQDILSPVKTYTGFLQMNYELPDFANSEIYTELLLNKRKSQQTDYRQLVLDYAVGSDLIDPAIAALSPLGAAGYSTLFDDPVQARAFIGFGNTKAKQDINFNRAVVGMKGDFVPSKLSDWKYDLSVQYATSDATYGSQQFFIDRIAASMFGCENAPGTGCVTAPRLTASTISGDLPQDWVDYVLQDTVYTTKYNEWTAAFNINGPVFTLPAGQLTAAFGIEHREAEIDDEPDANVVSGNVLNYSQALPTRGHDGVSEAYIEFNVPVLKNLPLAKELTVELAGRYTSDRTAGDANTYKTGIVYTPFDFLTLRASKGTSFRAPALYEQFQGATTGYLSQDTDPCNDIEGASVSDALRANCLTEVPADFVQNSSIADKSVGGAENGLKPETSVNTTLGFVFRPTFLPEVLGKFNLAVDHFDINISNGISQLGAQELLDLCYNSVAFRSGGSYCAYSTRDPVTNALTVTDGYINVSREISKGYDYDFRWTRKFGDVFIRADLGVTQYEEQSSALNPTDDMTDYNNTLGTPKWSGTLDLTGSYRNWTVHYGGEFIGAMDSSAYLGVDRTADGYKFWTKDYYLHNVSVSYEADLWTVVGGIRNIADVTPPSISSGYYDRIGNALLYSGYDLYGRQFFFDISRKF